MNGHSLINLLEFLLKSILINLENSKKKQKTKKQFPVLWEVGEVNMVNFKLKRFKNKVSVPDTAPNVYPSQPSAHTGRFAFAPVSPFLTNKSKMYFQECVN